MVPKSAPGCSSQARGVGGVNYRNGRRTNQPAVKLQSGVGQPPEMQIPLTQFPLTQKGADAFGYIGLAGFGRRAWPEPSLERGRQAPQAKKDTHAVQPPLSAGSRDLGDGLRGPVGRGGQKPAPQAGAAFDEQMRPGPPAEVSEHYAIGRIGIPEEPAAKTPLKGIEGLAVRSEGGT